jgi:hypothetical protein
VQDLGLLEQALRLGRVGGRESTANAQLRRLGDAADETNRRLSFTQHSWPRLAETGILVN